MDKRCSVPECTNKVLARGLCAKHYERRRRYGTADDPAYKARGKVCSVEGCGRPVLARMLCRPHYRQQWKEAAAATPLASVVRLFWAKVDKGDEAGCWWWRGARTPEGYGRYTVGKRTMQAHRLAYELVVGPIPDGLVVHHRCRHALCVRPDHLELIEPSAHSRLTRALGSALQIELPERLPPAQRQFCKQGHPYDDENTYRSPDGKRHCRICMKRRTNAWRAQHPIKKP